MNDDDLLGLWQGQQSEPPAIDAAELRRKADKLVKVVRRRNIRELVAGLLGSLPFVVVVFLPGATWPVRLSSLAILIGGAVVLAHLFKHGRVDEPLPGDAPTSEVLAYHRVQLRRQRDLLRSVPRWYLAPLAPGLIGFGLATTSSWRGVTIHLATFSAIFAGGWWLNARGAKSLNAELEALESGSVHPGL